MYAAVLSRWHDGPRLLVVIETQHALQLEGDKKIPVKWWHGSKPFWEPLLDTEYTKTNT